MRSLQLCTLLVTVLVLWAGSALSGDFDRNGASDLLIGAPYKTVGSGVYAQADAGMALVMYGLRSKGLRSTEIQSMYQSGLLGEVAEPNDALGFSLAVGDFNCDGTSDAVIGIPGQEISVKAEAGSVQVVYGQPGKGLQSAGTEVLYQGLGAILSTGEMYDEFGRVLAAGDFNNDGCSDLAVGTPYENWNGIPASGVVQVIYGSSNAGLNKDDSVTFRQGQNGLQGSEEVGDAFGSALATGDFNNDGFDDLAVGVPGEDNSNDLTSDGMGKVQVVFGSNSGLTTAGSLFWGQGATGVSGTPEAGDQFGASLCTGDFDGDGYADLAVGVPGEDLSTFVDAGVVQIFPGSPTGPTATGSTMLNQSDLSQTVETGDEFGFPLTSGDFDGDGYDDLVVSAIREDLLSTADNCGCVTVIKGGETWLSTLSHQVWFQGDLHGLQDSPETDDFFGYSLAVGDFDDDGFEDLVIGVPYENVVYNSVDQVNAGGVHVIYGSSGGLSATGDQFWNQDNSNLDGVPLAGARFGHAVAALPPGPPLTLTPLHLLLDP